MSFIPKQDKTPKTRINVHLRQDVAAQAKRYAEYLDSDLDHVVEQLFLKAFKADKEFQKTASADSTQPTPVPVPERTGIPAKKPETTAEKVA
ncbi:MAG TPA: hypothetical protein VFB14_27765 [Bryobacteraceae bacterium]|jgi:hypothetical protein|nr:hypothetical protein [Bryobacteraceae bacterium]